jgi:hypothetical protein
VLLENPGTGGSLNHLGVEVPDTDTVDAEQTRLAALGMAATDERGTTCCYAKQDKFWVEGTPNGERWEIYTVLSDSATFFGDPGDGPACCADSDTTPDSATPETDSSTTDATPQPATACC